MICVRNNCYPFPQFTPNRQNIPNKRSAECFKVAKIPLSSFRIAITHSFTVGLLLA